MRISKYTFLFTFKNEYYIYNTLSNAMLRIDNDTYSILVECQKNKVEIEREKCDTEFYNLLEDKRFICENEKDEFLVYKSILAAQRNGTSHAHITIAPTMDCNFRCHYCFEKKTQTYMSSEIIDSILKYISRQKELTSIMLTWFGGEPLMAIDKIKEFYDKFIKNCGNREFNSDIITTAYYITPEVIEILKYVKIRAMQITLDGLKDSHNKIKITEGCDDVFSKIIQNIDLLVEKAPEIHITIRVNLTKENINEYVELYRFLTNRYDGKNIGIAPAFVNNRGVDADKDSPIYFSNKECANYILNLFYQAGIHSPFLTYPARFFEECAIRSQTSIAFDPEGYAYKCWEIIGNKKYAIGKLDEEGDIVDVNLTMLNRMRYGADALDDKTCSKCAYLPICSGGCPIHRIQNEFEGQKNDCCTFCKGYLPHFMRAHLMLKKAGFENK
ncbi:MAG: SPASM domain-containing protein [Bacteroidales bacterium]|jgi:uncharacterized protein|nr:SPASM domain-containing protein [Bacteroidales bacterium]